MSGYRITRVITPAESLALVSLDDAKAAVGIDPADTSQDAALTRMVDSVSAAINNWCDRVFVMQTYRDQIRNGRGAWGQPLVTRQYPIIEDDGSPTVTEDGAVLDPAFLEIYPETGSIYRLDSGSTAPSGWGASLIVVDYVAGFDPIPADVQAAALEWLTSRYHAAGRDPALRSETIPDLITQVYAGDSGAGTSAGSMTPGARDLLEPYRLMTV